MKKNKYALTVLLVVTFSVSLSLTALAETPEMWGNLEMGQYDIGFKSIEKYDYSRVYQAKYDYFGNTVEGNRARPIQINIWYPAANTENEYAMVYGEYAYSYPDDDTFIDILSQLQNREINHLNRIFMADGLTRSFMDNSMAAVKDAQPAEGEFPLIIYHPHLTSTYLENVVLCEYLASHGFIVATSHPIGHTNLMPEVNNRDIETQLSDAEFIFEHMRNEPQYNKTKLGSLGFGVGSFTSILFQMRNSDVDAVAGLGNAFIGASYFNLMRDNSYYNLNQVQRPLMHIYFENEATDMTLIDSMIYSNRFSYLMKESTMGNFNINGYIASTRPDATNPDKKSSDVKYELVCRYVRHFFNAKLNNNEASNAFINKSSEENSLKPYLLTVKFQPASEVPPTTAQFMAILQQQSVTEAVALYDKFKIINPDAIQIPEGNINMFGYGLINQGRTSEACEVMRINAETYPHHANCWDSYADALLADGNNAKAAECFKKLLEVVEADEVLNDNTKTVIINNANNFLNNINQENNN